MTSAASLPYDHPTRLGLRQLAGGDVEAALESARGYQRQHHVDHLPAAAVPGVLAGLKRKVLKVLQAAGLFVVLEGGGAFEVRSLDQADTAALAALLEGKPAGAPSASTLRQRRRRQRLRAELDARLAGEGTPPPSSPQAPSLARGELPPAAPAVPPSMRDPAPGHAPGHAAGHAPLSRRDSDGCHAVTEVVTSPSSPPPPAQESAETPPFSSRTGGVTPSRVPARGISPSSLSIPFSKEEGEGEIPPSPPVTPSAVTPPLSAPPPSAPPTSAPASSRPAGVVPLGSLLPPLAPPAPPAAPAAEDEPAPPIDPAEARAAQVATWWREATGLSLAARDEDAVRVRVQEGASLEDFRAALAHVLTEAWFQADDSRRAPRVACGKLWAECVRKGRSKLSKGTGAGSPPSSPRSAAAGPSSTPAPALPPLASAPPKPAPERVPFSERPTHSPARKLPCCGQVYVPVPELGAWLRPDVLQAHLASLAPEATG